MAFLDDCFLLESSSDQCSKAIFVQNLLHDLVFLVNQEKSFIPKQEIKFLGYVINSISMTVRPTEDKREKAINLILTLRNSKLFTVREAASLNGLLNDMCKGVD